MSDTGHIHSCLIRSDGRAETLGDPALLFPYWSFTKTVIAVCALRLEEQGRLSLDDTVADRSITLGQCLTHTAGLPDYGALPAYHRAVAGGEAPWPRDRLLSEALAQGALLPPGQGWRYSNIGYLFAREHLEAVSGCGLDTLVRQEITAPLGLHSVVLATTPESFAAVCWPEAAGYHPGWVYHGCLVGTAGDAARLLHALFAGALVQRKTLARMMTPHPVGGVLPGRPWTTCGYGIGLMAGEAGASGRVIGHSGAGPFSVNAVYHFPDVVEPVTVACFTDGRDEGVAEFEAVRLAGGCA